MTPKETKVWETETEEDAKEPLAHFFTLLPQDRTSSISTPHKGVGTGVGAVVGTGIGTVVGTVVGAVVGTDKPAR